ncbi:hypothetical protein [Actinomadura sp. HBU206391]|uniref:hypothetical protein n=1 Tax=Actinomadura sp. HBU206391 TaxID=2731692 RepID=UPI00164F61E6|nr:hypothetical protein [Actinomadura sp. HBU206391]MBC6458899.1 hypothetical protein [Actinomadura sp. HBU206391]
MVNRRIATALGGIVIGALALATTPAYADAASGHGTASRSLLTNGATGQVSGLTDSRSRSAKDDRSARPKRDRGTKIVGFDADPSRVHKGGRLKLRGTLRSRSGHEKGLGHQRVHVYFRPNNSHGWRHIDSTETRSNGSFSTRVRAYQSGTWSVRFTSGRLGDSKADDFVKVIG